VLVKCYSVNNYKCTKAVPECKRNDGAGFSLTHCYRNSLMLIHQIVLVWVTNISKKEKKERPLLA